MMSKRLSLSPVAAALALVSPALVSPAGSQTMTPNSTRTEHLTSAPYSLRILKDGTDITAAAGITRVQYNRDGSGTRTLADGRVINGSWRFLDAEQKVIETTSPLGTQVWDILELDATRYRKREQKTGIVIEHTPIR